MSRIRGSTLVESMIVVAIIATLALIAVPSVREQPARSTFAGDYSSADTRGTADNGDGPAAATVTNDRTGQRAAAVRLGYPNSQKTRTRRSS